MDELPHAPPTDRDDIELLGACLDQAADGIDLAYRVLDRLGERSEAGRMALVVRPEGLGPQVFVRGGALDAVPAVGDLAWRPAGIFDLTAEPVPRGVEGAGPAFTRACELALLADLACHQAIARPGTLASRMAMEQAMARAAARSARYGWAHTAVLLTVILPEIGPATPAALGAAVVAAARVGDDVGTAVPGCALAVLGNAGSDAVAPFVDRVRRALQAAGVSPAARVEMATVSMPRETVDPEEAWRLAVERLADRLGRWPVHDGLWTGTLPSGLELELRALEGVVAVGSAGRGFSEPPQLAVVAADADHGLHGEVTRRVAEWFGDDAVPVVTVGTHWRPVTPAAPAPTANGNGLHATWPAPATPQGTNGAVASTPTPTPTPDGEQPRVVLLTSRFDGATGTSEVLLGRGGMRAAARAAGGPLVGGAQATLAALGMLGFEVPFYVRTVDRVRGVLDDPVVVVLAPRTDGRATGEQPGAARLGVAVADEEVAAAGKATLGALNRYLAGSRVPHPAAP